MYLISRRLCGLHNPITTVFCSSSVKRRHLSSFHRKTVAKFVSMAEKSSKRFCSSVKDINSDAMSVQSNATQREMDLRKILKDKIDGNEVFCSFELYPVNQQDIYQRFFAEMNKYSPLFYALTWHKKPAANTYLSLELIDRFPGNTVLHLTARGLNRTDVETVLAKALASGILNICALRGDCESEDSEFSHAVDLVRFIRTRFGDRFCIFVAGYPEMHPESSSKGLDLLYLKEKVDAGADVIMTQIFFEADTFINFVKDCREIGIFVPIIPGIFPIPDFKSLERMTRICKVEIPKAILKDLQPIKHDDEAVSNYGVELATRTIKDILQSGVTHGFHLFTLNRTPLSMRICDRISPLH